MDFSFSSKQEEQAYKSCFSHFAMRLLERHNIYIVFEDYYFLSKLPYLRNPKKYKDGNEFGTLIIKGHRVKVLRANWKGGVHPLLTVFPNEAIS